MNPVEVTPIIGLKRAIPLPEIPPSVRDLYSQEGLQRIFSDPNRGKAFLTMQTINLARLLNPNNMWETHNLWCLYGNELLGAVGVNDDSDREKVKELFPDIEGAISKIEIYKVLHQHAETVINLRDQFEYNSQHFPELFSDAARMFVERTEDDLRFVLSDPYNNYSKYIATDYYTGEDISKATRMDLTRIEILKTLTKLTNNGKQAEAMALAEWIGYTYAQNRDPVLFKSLNHLFPNTFAKPIG